MSQTNAAAVEEWIAALEDEELITTNGLTEPSTPINEDDYVDNSGEVGQKEENSSDTEGGDSDRRFDETFESSEFYENLDNNKRENYRHDQQQQTTYENNTPFSRILQRVEEESEEMDIEVEQTNLEHQFNTTANEEEEPIEVDEIETNGDAHNKNSKGTHGGNIEVGVESYEGWGNYPLPICGVKMRTYKGIFGGEGLSEHIEEKRFGKKDHSKCVGFSIPDYRHTDYLNSRIQRPEQFSPYAGGHLVITNLDKTGASTGSRIYVSKCSIPARPHPIFAGKRKNSEKDQETLGKILGTSRGKLGEGIEWSNNSCYLDATLFAMFYGTTIFDQYLFTLYHCHNPDDWTALKTAHALRTIATLLRDEGFCPSRETAKLRDVIFSVNSKIKDSMMDVDEFMHTLFGRALKLKHFINYHVGSKNFLHQIMTDPNELVDFQVKDMLTKSMEFQNLKFAKIPAPALIVKMPVSDGVPRFSTVLPNLTLNISNLMENSSGSGMDSMAETTMHLLAVIALKDRHFTAYVRDMDMKDPHCSDNWVYFDSMQCKIIRQYGFSNYLKVIEMASEIKLHERHDESRKVLDMMKDCYICIYFSHALWAELGNKGCSAKENVKIS